MKLHNKKSVGCDYQPDTVKADRRRYGSDDSRRGLSILYDAQRCWDKMDRFRKERERCCRYCYGDQWSDPVMDEEGRTMTEEEYLARENMPPLKTNLIRRLVRNVLGQFRQQTTEPVCTARDRNEQRQGESMSTILQYNRHINSMGEVEARSLEDFLIGGLAVHRKWFGDRGGKVDCWTDYVCPNNFFIDPAMRDFRGHDCTIVGMVHDLSLREVRKRFAKSPAEDRELMAIYSGRDRDSLLDLYQEFGYSRLRNYDFIFSPDPSRCRVVEVWRKEARPRYRCHDWNTGELYTIEPRDKAQMVDAVNAARLKTGAEMGMPADEIPLIDTEWFVDNYWYYYFLAPDGRILDEGESPYNHRGHPFVFKAYPFIDGEIHSFVSDIIDQQRYTNRLIMLNDMIIRSSAKGVLMVPEGSMGNLSREEIERNWSRVNSVMIYRPDKATGAAPHQISANSTNVGIHEMLSLHLKFMEDISGVNGALQGRPGFAGTSGSLYAQMTQNAATSLLDILETFSSFVLEGANKDVKNIQQYYTPDMVLEIAGKDADITYDPSRLADVDFNLSIMQSKSTPAYRAIANEFLMQLLQAGQISLEDLLEHGDFPFADALLQTLKSRKEQMAQGQQPQGIDPAILQQAQQGANPQAMEMLQQAAAPE